MFESEVLRRIFGTKMGEVREKCIIWSFMTCTIRVIK